jgi:hypothetical protein
LLSGIGPPIGDGRAALPSDSLAVCAPTDFAMRTAYD